MFLRRALYHFLGWDNASAMEKPAEEENKTKLETSSHATVTLQLLESEINVSKDALNDYQLKLSKTSQHLQKILDQLNGFKIKLINEDSVLKTYADNLPNAKEKIKIDLINSIRNLFHYLFESVKSDLEPSNSELNNLLESSHQQMKVLFQELIKNSDVLQDTAKLKSEKRQLFLEILNFNIEIVLNLLKLMDNILDEIEYCLDIIKVNESVILDIIEMAVCVFMKVPLPNLDFDFSKFYDHYLANEISEKKIMVDNFKVDSKNEIKETEKVGKNVNVNGMKNFSNHSDVILFSRSKSMPENTLSSENASPRSLNSSM